VELEVTNTGPPVPPYEVPLLFEPFRRLGPDRGVTGKGAGLGLSIVRAIARAHDGEVTAVPREAGGLTVAVTLPREPDPAGKPQSVAPALLRARTDPDRMPVP
jgi:signal transduction histidine kinase